MIKSKSIRQGAVAAALALAFAGSAFAAGDAHSHDHAASEAKLVLNQGQKWPTDAPLRQGMENIRSAVAKGMKDEALAKAVETEVAGIVQNCKLEPEADEQLHIVIAELMAGAEAKDSAKVAKALNAAMPVSVITTAGMAIGTPAYMAPEQLAGDPAADHRIDIYAVGLLAYELLTGDSPFTGPSPQATMAAQLTRDPEPLYQCCPDVPPPLSAIIMQCLAKEPDQRPPSAEAVMTALDSITTSSGDVKHPLPPTLPAVGRRKRRIALATALATVATGVAVVVFASQRETPSEVRNAHVDTTSRATAEASATAPAAPPAAQVAAPVPVVLTRDDSMAIAKAVRQRLAEEQADKGTRVMGTHVTDSIIAFTRRVAIDSII